MINRLIDEIHLALDHDLYLSALALALVLPDACARVEFQTEQKNSDRYKSWYKKYIGEIGPDWMDLPNIDENVAYSLRCCFLHEGNPNIQPGYGVDKFELLLQKKISGPDYEVLDNEDIVFHLKYFDMMGKNIETSKKYYRLNVRSYCERICECVSQYYNENKDRFSFDYTIVNWEDVKP